LNHTLAVPSLEAVTMMLLAARRRAHT
jgi:hypothetical protein